jgi:hypothetical protein
VCTGGNYPPINGNEGLEQVTTWMSHESIMLSDLYQIKKATGCLNLFM